MSHYPMLDRCDYAEHGLRGDTYFIPKKHFLTLFRKKLKTAMIFFFNFEGFREDNSLSEIFQTLV